MRAGTHSLSRPLLRVTVAICFVLTSSMAIGHPGDTDYEGCHYCWTNCYSWGEVYGEKHCHPGEYTSTQGNYSSNEAAEAQAALAGVLVAISAFLISNEFQYSISSALVSGESLDSSSNPIYFHDVSNLLLLRKDFSGGGYLEYGAVFRNTSRYSRQGFGKLADAHFGYGHNIYQFSNWANLTLGAFWQPVRNNQSYLGIDVGLSAWLARRIHLDFRVAATRYDIRMMGLIGLVYAQSSYWLESDVPMEGTGLARESTPGQAKASSKRVPAHSHPHGGYNPPSGCKDYCNEYCATKSICTVGDTPNRQTCLNYCHQGIRDLENNGEQTRSDLNQKCSRAADAISTMLCDEFDTKMSN